MTSLPSSTYSSVQQQQQQQPTSYTSQLGHPTFSVGQTSLTGQTSLAQPNVAGTTSTALQPTSLHGSPYSNTSPYHTALGGLGTTSGVVTQSTVLPFSTATSTFSTTSGVNSFVGTNAFGTTGIANTGMRNCFLTWVKFRFIVLSRNSY